MSASPSAPPPASVRPSAPPPPAANLPPDLLEQRTKILKRSEEITKLDYFQMLGVGREATTEEVQKAYFVLARAWHPDRLPAPLLDVKDHCTKVFAHISEAHQTLTDEERRRHYMTLVKDGGATPDDQQIIMNVLEAATNFQKAEVCLRRNDLAQAEQLVRAAHTADPKQADYLALLAWLEAMKPDAQSNQATQAKIAMLDEAVKLNGRCERAYFYRGMLFKRLGNEKSAYKDFKESAELNPRNVDAVREVRLYAMRKDKAGKSVPPGPASGAPGRSKKPEPASGGIFGKLFKK
jgi:tetratricopeptide (TPR) repeat protein